MLGLYGGLRRLYGGSGLDSRRRGFHDYPREYGLGDCLRRGVGVLARVSVYVELGLCGEKIGIHQTTRHANKTLPR
jgi:hypothetical protein